MNPSEEKTELRTVDEMIEWMSGQLVEAEKALRSREQMAATWKEGTNAEWAAVAKFHPSTAKEPPMTKAQRLAASATQSRIAIKCRHDVSMIKAILAALNAIKANQEKK